jgi:hypothetical protein
MSYSSWQIQGRIDEFLGRYEFVEGKSAKFWECLKDGDNPGQFATRWGAIKLTKTRHNTKNDMSRMEAANKIAEKLNKGYRLVSNSQDVMDARFAEEDAVALRKNTVTAGAKTPDPVVKEVVEETPPPPPARRRL